MQGVVAVDRWADRCTLDGWVADGGWVRLVRVHEIGTTAGIRDAAHARADFKAANE